MPELASITIKGYKSIASIESLKLGAINVLIGANGSGKSNFIGAFSFLHAIREGRLQEYVIKAGGAERVLHFGSKVTDRIDLHIDFRDGINQYSLSLHPTESDRLVPNSEYAYYWDKSNYPSPYSTFVAGMGLEAGIGAEKNDQKVARYVRKRLDSWRVYHVHDTGFTSPLKKTADVDDNRYLRPEGTNLAAFLYYLKKKHDSAYGMICQTVRNVAPFFDDFVLEPQKLNPDKIRLEWRHKGSDAYFDASALSDGTLRFIALATLFLQPENLRPSVILVDEPELGLHPYAITLFASLVKQAAVRTQVILSTQSSSLVDHFEPEDVLVADRVDGGTQLTRLDSDRLEPWLENYSLGQLWEKNEIGGRPAAESAHV